MTGPDGPPFCPGKVHENTPFTLIIGQFLMPSRSQVNRRAILICQNRTKKHITSTWFRQFDLPKVHTNRRFFKYNPFNATLPEINCKSSLAFPPWTSASYRTFCSGVLHSPRESRLRLFPYRSRKQETIVANLWRRMNQFLREPTSQEIH